MNVNPTDLLAQLAAANTSAAPGARASIDPSQISPGKLAGAGLTDVAKPNGAQGSFESLMTQFVSDVNQSQLKADEAVQALAAGETDNVHDVVLTAVKANLSVRMLFEIRNQLVQAYQEVMRMQL